MATPLSCCAAAAVCAAGRLNKKCHRPHNGGASPKTALRLFRGHRVFLCPGGQSCRTNNRGDAANAARGVDSSDFFAIVGFLSARQVDSGGEKTKAVLPKWHRRSIRSPLLVGAPLELQSTAGQITKVTLQQQRWTRMRRARRPFSLPGEVGPPSK